MPFRNALGKSQTEFGSHIGYSRSAVASAETTPGVPSDAFLKALIERFPTDKAAIEAAYAQYATAPKRETPQPPNRVPPIVQAVENHIAWGELRTARRQIQLALRSATDHTRFLLLEQLGRIEAMGGGFTPSDLHILEAIELGEQLYPGDDRVIALWDQMLDQLIRSWQYELAEEQLERALVSHVDSPILWLRKGVLSWHRHRYSEAYADLTTALQLGAARLTVLHSRGQVLAEWGNYEAAVTELDEVIAESRISLAQAAYARSTRAYALYKLGETTQAFQEFALAQAITPDNAWLHYFRARCYEEREDPFLAVSEYGLALALQEPRLNQPKAEYAHAALERLPSLPRR